MNEPTAEPRRFPIQNGPSVPWDVMAPHESMAERNHNQTLERLSQRGGLSPGEAWCVVNGIRLDSRETKAQWEEWTREWFKFAIRVNLHFEKLSNYDILISKLRLACGDQKSDDHDWADAVIGLLRVARSQRDDEARMNAEATEKLRLLQAELDRICCNAEALIPTQLGPLDSIQPSATNGV